MHHDWIVKTAILSEDNRHGASVVINDGAKNCRKDFIYEGPWKDSKTTEAKVFIDLANYLLKRNLPRLQFDTHTIAFYNWLADNKKAVSAKDREIAARAHALCLSLQSKTEVLLIPPAPTGMARGVIKRERSAGSAASRRIHQIKDRPEFKLVDELDNLVLVDGSIDNYPSAPQDKFQLTYDQEMAYGAMWEFFFSGKKGGRVLTLIGSAGTGKTSLTSKFAMDVQRRGFRVALTAPTNKASQVLSVMSARECRTIHKLLGLRMGVNTDDPLNPKEVLTKDPWSRSEFPSQHLVIIDEASMVSRKLRSGQYGIQDNILKSRTKVIFLGDDCQLPPVHEKNSVVFEEKNQIKITEIVRQSHDNPLLEVLIKLRDNLKDETKLERKSAINEGKGISFVSGSDELLKIAIEMFGIQKESGNNQYCRLLAWRNDQVDAYNFAIRNKLIGRDLKNFVPGEVLINNTPVLNSKGETISYSSQELVVLEHEEIEDEFHVRVVKYLLEDVYTKEPVVIPVIHNKGITAFQRMMSALSENAKASLTKEERKEKWDLYYRRRSMYAKLTPGYALTVHRAQGSTFEHIIVDDNDISLNKRIQERNQCRYVALSRARKTAIVL